MVAHHLSVEIVMATYNGARFVLEQLQSLSVQTRLPDRLVVADDASSDETLDIVRDFAATAPFPVDVRSNTTNVGYGENFLRAASGTNADVVAFCDQDDVWRPDKLERMTAALRDPEVQLCAHTADLIDAEGRPLPGRLSQGIGEDRIAPRLSLKPWDVFFGFSVAFRSSLLGLLPAVSRGLDPTTPPQRLAHDRWIYFLGSVAGKTALLSEPLARYRQHNANLFGAPVTNASSLLRQQMPFIRENNDTFLRASQDKLALLEHAAAAASDVDARKVLGEGADFWRAVARHYAVRGELYEQPKGLARLRRFTANLAEGAYRLPHDRKTSWRAVTKDGLATFKP